MRQGEERESGIYIGENKKLLFCFVILLQYHCKFTMVLDRTDELSFLGRSHQIYSSTLAQHGRR